jgi:hypothetical protein
MYWFIAALGLGGALLAFTATERRDSIAPYEITDTELRCKMYADDTVPRYASKDAYVTAWRDCVIRENANAR